MPPPQSPVKQIPQSTTANTPATAASTPPAFSARLAALLVSAGPLLEVVAEAALSPSVESPAFWVFWAGVLAPVLVGAGACVAWVVANWLA